MREIRLSAAAKADLIDIWTETARTWGAAQADGYLDAIDGALTHLIDNPLLGPDCSDILAGTRRLVTGRHLVFYEITGEAIFVIRVLHQSMEVSRHLPTP